MATKLPARNCGWGNFCGARAGMATVLLFLGPAVRDHNNRPNRVPKYPSYQLIVGSVEH